MVALGFNFAFLRFLCFSVVVGVSAQRPSRMKALATMQHQGFESAEYLQAAERAFNRARGHHAALTFRRFHATLIQESSSDMPVELAQRVFAVWNRSASAELSLSEFLDGVLLFVRGSRKDHLRHVFKIILNGKPQGKITREDTAALLRCFGPPSTVVATPESTSLDSAQPSTTCSSISIAQFCSMLHPSASAVVSEDEFCEFLCESRWQNVSSLLLIDWITTIGDCLMCMLNEDQPQAGISPRASLRSVPSGGEKEDLEPSFIPQKLSRAQRDATRKTLIDLIESTESNEPNETVSDMEKDFADAYQKATNNDQVVRWIFEWTKYMEARNGTLPTNRQQRFHKWFVLGLCCSQSRSIEQVYRALFELFDIDNRGRLNVSSVSSFLQLVQVRGDHLENSYSVHATMPSALFAASNSLPPSPVQGRQRENDTGAIMTFMQFVDLAQQQEGFSLSEVQISLTLFHLHAVTKLVNGANIVLLLRQVINGINTAIEDKQDFIPKGFFLCAQSDWKDVAKRLSKHDSSCLSSSGTRELARLLDNEVTIVSKEYVALPVSIWLGISFWFACHNGWDESTRDWRKWSTSTALLNALGFPAVHHIAISTYGQDTIASWTGKPQFHSCVIPNNCSITTIVDAATQCFDSKGDTELFKCTIGRASMPETTVEIAQDLFSLALSDLLHNLPEPPHNFMSHDLSFELELSDAKTPVSKQESSGYASKPEGKIMHGLVNLGNTCFMNSALQCLAVTPILREYFQQDEFNHDHTIQLSPAHKHAFTLKKEYRSYSLVHAFAHFLQEISRFSTTGEAEKQTAVTPLNMYSALGSLLPSMCDGTQQDAQEFISSFISRLSEELHRHPEASSDQEASILSPQSRSILSRIAAMGHEDESESPFETTNGRLDARSSEKISPSDSDGRHDSIVAMEWWISHLINEPSVITCFFSGQFKSVLTCTNCGKQSTRFEPFTSLQLPLVNRVKTEAEAVDITAILHFAVVSRSRLPRRIVVQAKNDWTVANLLGVIARDYLATEDDKDTSMLVAAEWRGNLIEGIYEEEMLLATIPMPIYICELDASCSHVPLGQGSSDVYGSVMKAPGSGDSVLVQVSKDRLVKGIVSVAHEYHHHSSAGLRSYDVLVTEGIPNGTTIRRTTDVVSLAATKSRVLYLRFIHRSTILTPFYCGDPHRLTIVGTPFMVRVAAETLTGYELYIIVSKRLFGRSLYGSPRRRANDAEMERFVLRRVSDDGKSCARCHWVKNCCGCVIDEGGNDLLSLAMDETIAIDWEYTPPPAIQSPCVEDDESYINFRKQRSQSISDSLAMLCSEEKLEAHCSACQHHQQNQEKPRPTYSPHTKQLSLWSLPPILVLQLKRFELAVGPDGALSWQKLEDRVDFPLVNLDLSAFLSAADGAHSEASACGARCCEPLDARVLRGLAFLRDELGLPLDSASRACAAFDLFAVVNHAGALDAGHYTAAVRRAGRADWWLADDARVSRLDAAQLAPSAAAYVLFLVRRDVATAAQSQDEGRRVRQPREFFPRRPTARTSSSERQPPGKQRHGPKGDKKDCAVM